MPTLSPAPNDLLVGADLDEAGHQVASQFCDHIWMLPGDVGRLARVVENVEEKIPAMLSDCIMNLLEAILGKKL